MSLRLSTPDLRGTSSTPTSSASCVPARRASQEVRERASAQRTTEPGISVITVMEVEIGAAALVNPWAG